MTPSGLPPRRSKPSTGKYRRDRLLLQPLAPRVLRGALQVGGGERVLIVVDHSHRQVGEVFAEACQDIGASPWFYVLEDLGPRPHQVLPPALMQALAHCEASVFVADFVEGEASMRREYLLLATQYRVRHAHMVGLSVDSLISGLQTDPRRIEQVGQLLRAKLRGKRSLQVSSPAGTRLEIKLDRRFRWVIHSGIIESGTWENLPSGELMTHPANVSGVYVCDMAFSGPLGAERGSMQNSPIFLTFEQGRVTDVTCADQNVADFLRQWMASGKNYDRVGVVTLGINIGITQPTGEIICDQNLPGLHVSLGSTFPEETGADWDTDGQIVFTGTNQDIDVGTTPLMRSGQYLQII